MATLEEYLPSRGFPFGLTRETQHAYDIPLPSEIERRHLHYQPILWRGIEGQEDEVTFEQFLRYPGHNALDLIKQFHESGVGEQAEFAIFRQVCEQLTMWEQENGITPTIGVNFAPVHFGRHGIYPSSADMFVRMVGRTMEETGINPAQLEIEITEYSAMVNKYEAAQAMLALKAMGLHIKADDVGLDFHSDIDGVLELPYDTIKLDESFSKDIETDSAKQAQVCAIVDKAHAKGMTVVAEKVDTQGKLRFFDEVAGCDGFQGWLFSAAVPADMVNSALYDTVIARGRL
ncbi:MAG: hypothetical protein RI947_1260 [Candidatus Parcubacteria bacterium]|jgi:EAL domain-containing protein (putative c-di-GMP-specific phosphodiesterase class I)